MAKLLKLTATQRIVAWRLSTGRTISLAELVSALYSNDPDGGPVSAHSVIRHAVSHLSACLRPLGLRIVNHYSLGWRIPEADLPAFLDALSEEVETQAWPRRPARTSARPHDAASATNASQPLIGAG